MAERPTVSLDSIASGKDAVESKTAPDERDKQEVADLKHLQEVAHLDALNQVNQDRAANRTLRKNYANRVFCYMVAYSIICAIFVVCAGWKIGGFELSDAVLGILVGSTATAAIGLVGFVVNGLFKSPS